MFLYHHLWLLSTCPLLWMTSRGRHMTQQLLWYSLQCGKLAIPFGLEKRTSRLHSLSSRYLHIDMICEARVILFRYISYELCYVSLDMASNNPAPTWYSQIPGKYPDHIFNTPEASVNAVVLRISLQYHAIHFLQISHYMDRDGCFNGSLLLTAGQKRKRSSPEGIPGSWSTSPMGGWLKVPPSDIEIQLLREIHENSSGNFMR